MTDSQEDGVYDVEYIVKHRTRNGKKQYLIKWLGFPSSENTWENEENLFCEELKRAYEEKVEKERVPKKKSKEKEPIKPKEPESVKEKEEEESEDDPRFLVTITNEWATHVKRVMGVSMGKGRGAFEVEYVTKDGKFAVCPSSEMHIKAPLKLLDFYEEHLAFTE